MVYEADKRLHLRQALNILKLAYKDPQHGSIEEKEFAKVREAPLVSGDNGLNLLVTRVTWL